MEGNEGNTKIITEWESPASSYPEEQLDNFRITKHIIRQGKYSNHFMDGYEFWVSRNAVILTVLQEYRCGHWEDWMVDSPHDYGAMQKYAEMSTGRVLTTGLGLGLVLHDLCKNEKVTDITVVERCPTVIELVGKQITKDPRIHIIQDDFWTFVHNTKETWDTLIVDIWVWRGAKECFAIYRREIIPARIYLETRFPDAQVIFHSFNGRVTPWAIKRAESMTDIVQDIYGMRGK